MNKTNSTKLILQLPEYLVKTIKAYERTDNINIDRFVISSIDGYIQENEIVSSNEVGNEYPKGTLPLVVWLPKAFAFKLNWEFQIKRHISLSDIAEELLSHSLANLITEIQAQEDYRLEVELE